MSGRPALRIYLSTFFARLPGSVLIGKQFGSGRKQRRSSAAILRLGERVSLSHVLNQFSKLK
jgi:hypothetical protein